MLVLSRRQGESIVLPRSHTTIVVVKTGRNRVTLGIVAPESVLVERSEISPRQTQLPSPCDAPEG